MAVDIDKLQIEIEASADKAVSGIDKLAATLQKLKTATRLSWSSKIVTVRPKR